MTTEVKGITYGYGEGDNFTESGNRSLMLLAHYANIAFAQNPEATAGLAFGYFGGLVRDGAWVAVPAGTVAVADDATSYVQRTPAGLVRADTVGFAAEDVPIAVVTAAGGAITAVADARPAAGVVPAEPIDPDEGVDATHLQGTLVAAAQPLDGDTLRYDAEADAYLPFPLDEAGEPWVPARGQGEVQTGALGVNEATTADMAVGATGLLLSATLDGAGRVRFYTSDAARTADAARAAGTDPLAGTGVVADLVFTGPGTIRLAPLASYANPTGGALLYIAIENRGAAGETRLLGVTFLTLEP